MGAMWASWQAYCSFVPLRGVEEAPTRERMSGLGYASPVVRCDYWLSSTS
jgi:hypothetical protein